MKKLLIPLGMLLLLILVYFAGPTPDTPQYDESWPQLPADVQRMQDSMMAHEASLPLRPHNEAVFYWHNGIYQPTEYVFLYLHGFSASRVEGHPVNIQTARIFAANSYLARLDAHGFKEDQLSGMTASGLWRSAVEALAIAHRMGRKVIIMSTSTGGTLALKLAASYPDKVHALINLSPNLRINNPAARILNDPWGLQIARAVYGGSHRRIEHPQENAPLYWDTLYPAEATVQLEELLETTMEEETFAAVECPVLTLYYYKNDQAQDQVVDVSVIPDMHEALGTPVEQKQIVALSTPGNHVIGSDIKSKDWQVVQEEIVDFCQQVLGMKARR